jgi:hypothetical protein
VFVTGTPALAADPGRPRVFSFAIVDLAPDADVNAFVESIVDRSSPEAGVTVEAAALRATVVDRTIEPYVRALTLFAAIAALAALGVLGPAILRWAAIPESDRGPLRAAGLGRHELRLASAARGAALGAVGAAGAIAIAVAASGRFPFGVAARIEPDPGIRLDGVVLGLGAVVIIVISASLGAAAPTAARSATRRPSRVADGLQASGVAPSVVAGVRAALAREGRSAFAAPTAVGVAIAIVALVTALTYQAGLSRLLDTPSRYGWTWDVAVESFGDSLPPELLDALDAEPTVVGLSIGRRTVLLRDGAAVPTFGFEQERGSALPTIVEGRAPTGDAEVALGGQTLDRLGAHIGDRLTFRGPTGAEVDVNVVGRTLIPLADPATDLSVSEGAVADGELLDRIGGADIDVALVDLVPGADAADLQAALTARGVSSSVFDRVVGPELSADLRGYDAVRRTPLLLATLLAVLGLGVLAHTIVAATRARRRELAVLSCLGFLRRDLRTSVRWNALTVVGVCIVVAVPIGIAIGRGLWRAFADGIGVVDDPLTPMLDVAAVVAVTVAFTLVLAAVTSRRVGSVRPAEVLRIE